MAALAIEINDASAASSRTTPACSPVEPGFARIDARQDRHGRAAKAARAPAAAPDEQPFLERAQHGARLGRRRPRQERRRARVCAARVVVAHVRQRRHRRRARRARRLPHGAARPAARPRAGMRHAGSRARRRGGGGERSAVPGAPARCTSTRGCIAASVTLLEQNGEAQVRAEHALEQGLAGIADAFARRIADLFVRATRFDPFTHAETEQPLYDRLPQWLDAAAARGARRARARISRRGVSRHGRARRRPRRRARLLPRSCAARRAASRARQEARRAGLRSRCGAAGFLQRARAARRRADRAVRAPDTPRAACCWRERLVAAQSSAQVKFVKRLPWRAEPRADRGASAACRAGAGRRRAGNAADASRVRRPRVSRRRRRASRSAARRIRSGAPWSSSKATAASRACIARSCCATASSSCAILSSFGTFVNERKVAGETTLKRADVIRIGSPGAELHVVSVEGAE